MGERGWDSDGGMKWVQIVAVPITLKRNCDVAFRYQEVDNRKDVVGHVLKGQKVSTPREQTGFIIRPILICNRRRD
jgi:hypothetical protein